MTGDYWQETVYAVPPLRNLDRNDESAVIGWVGMYFPFSGTKIDWGRAPGKHRHWETDDDDQLTSMASREICQRIRPGSAVEHVGDGLSPYGVRFTSDNAHSVVAALLEIPEHHYFLAEDRSWIVVVTIEGDLDVADQLPFGEARQ
ncbi:hypothetical protein [Microbispora sp. NPDC046933]|uniref:hypothetical protein n=1 Tax=Microbispora sp. NPDC046933 TaxID=3155618 RepID=UPI0033E2E0DA